MDKFLQYVLRFGPLVAAFALGLAAVVTPFFPDYAGLLNQFLAVLALFGVQPDQAIVGELSGLVAGVVALIGVARKLWSLVVGYFSQPQP